MMMTRLRNFLAESWLAATETTGVASASSEGFAQSTVEAPKANEVAFDVGGREACGPSRDASRSVLAVLFLASAVAAILLLLSDDAIARVGGGHSYSGGRRH